MAQQQPTAPPEGRMGRFDEFANERPVPDYGQPDELVRRLADAYVVSDSHFFHHNIIKMQDRPWNVDELMMERWNEVVGPDNLVLHCGDVVHTLAISIASK